ncbi:MAG: hypothetical protein KAJ49_00955, partial [Arcobacteraceae bacterium]|nr:hypothetical protein [Arcobacteraceae bacterium]
YVSGTNTEVTISGNEFNDVIDDCIENTTSNNIFTVTNNLFRNSTVGIYDEYISSYISSTNSEISNNTFTDVKYAIYEADENIAIKDNLFANNGLNYGTQSVLGTKTSNYEVDDRDLFKAYIHGQTTAIATDNGTNTTIIDSELSLIVDQLAGGYIQPDITKADQYLVLSNTADTITFVGTIDNSSQTSGTLYTLYDFRVTGDALTASSTSGIVGAFGTGNDPVFGYDIYTDTNTTSGTIGSNSYELWNNDFTITNTLNIYGKVRIARGLNIDVNSSDTTPAIEYIYLNKQYNFTMSDTESNRTTISSSGLTYWGYIQSYYSQEYKNLVIDHSDQHAIYQGGSYNKLLVENCIIQYADDRGIYASFDNSSLKIKDTRFINIDTDG